MDSRERVFPTSTEGVPSVIYTHAVAGWTQFWMFYQWDYSPLPWRRGHRCDWELVQVRDDDGWCVYGQHGSGETRPVPVVRYNDERPVVFVARGKHACYYTPGRHRTGRLDWDFADGQGRRVDPILEAAPADGWRHVSFGAIHAPGNTRRWRDPDGWAAGL